MRRALAVAGLMLLVAGCSSDDSASTVGGAGTSTVAPTSTILAEAGPAPSAGCGATPVADPGVSDRTMDSGGQERRFQLSVPDGYDGTTPLPVVFGLHALTVTYAVVSSIDGFGDVAGSYDFIGVFPSGRLDGITPYWLAAPVEPNYDVDFLRDLLDLVEAELCVDSTKVFSTGQSNGAQMSSLLACRLSDRITAVAPVDGVEFSDQCDGAPVPVMAFHGDADPIVTYEGGGLNAFTIADQQYWKGDVPEGLPIHGGVDDAMVNWAEHNGCDPEPVEERISPEVVRRSWNGCEAETVLYVVEGGGHAWPGRPQPAFEAQFGHMTTDIDATELMFEFFLGPPG
jgi:polyhydroxybutyrate depolymerase